jgi:hypothetical protein
MEDTNNRRTQGIFASTNRVRFEMAVDASGADWWHLEFGDLSPEGVGDMLSASWGGDKQMTVTEFDPIHGRFGIKVVGTWTSGDFWFHHRTLDMTGKIATAEKMAIPLGRQGAGTGRKLMGDLIRTARHLKLDRIRLDADEVGRYVWLRIGFVPDRGSWRAMQVDLKARASDMLSHLGTQRFLEILALITNANPEAARDLASMRDPVPSRERWRSDGTPDLVPLGRALFLESGARWSGELDLGDPVSMALADAYVSDGQP